jgi:predicted dehydrogenase
MSNAPAFQAGDNFSRKTSRREFLQSGTAAVAAGSVALNLALAPRVHARGSDVLRVGLVGCGGRGTGAARNALLADPNTKLVAMGDVFRDRLDESLRQLQASKDVAERVAVDEDHRFSGFDSYLRVIDSCDVVVLAEPPHFRPRHLRAAIDAGKHVFAEKPIAVDAPGVRSVMETTKLAASKGLSLVSGLCWRYDREMRATFDEIHKGTAGDVMALQCTYNSHGVWGGELRKARQECSSEMEYQLRNWYYYTWLSGDFNTEQHIHSLDKMLWAMQDQPPARATGSGGRQQRTDAKFGNIYDHFDVVYEYENGVKIFSRCRHWSGCASATNDFVFGTKGIVDVFRHRIEDLKGNVLWRNRGGKNSMYQAEHDALFASIRQGKPVNNGHYASTSTMLAILGRMVAYTGRELTWEQALASTESLGPQEYAWSDIPVPSVAIPGVTPFV